MELAHSMDPAPPLTTPKVYKNAMAATVRKIEAEKPGDFGAIAKYVAGENYRKSFQELRLSAGGGVSSGRSLGARYWSCIHVHCDGVVLAPRSYMH